MVMDQFGRNGATGGAGGTLRPQAPAEDPAWCTVYRGGVAYAGDVCDVRNERQTGQPSTSWLLFVGWDDAGTSYDPSSMSDQGLRAVAYDVDGNPVAWWDGRASS